MATHIIRVYRCYVDTKTKFGIGDVLLLAIIKKMIIINSYLSFEASIIITYIR